MAAYSDTANRVRVCKAAIKDDFVVTDHSNLHAEPVFDVEFRIAKFLLGALDSLNRGLSQLVCPLGSIDAVSGRSTAGSCCLNILLFYVQV